MCVCHCRVCVCPSLLIFIGALGVLVREIFDASADMQGGELKKTT